MLMIGGIYLVTDVYIGERLSVIPIVSENNFLSSTASNSFKTPQLITEKYF